MLIIMGLVELVLVETNSLTQSRYWLKGYGEYPYEFKDVVEVEENATYISGSKGNKLEKD